MEITDFKKGDLIAIAYANRLWYGVFYKYTGNRIQYFDSVNGCKYYVTKYNNRIVKVSYDNIPCSSKEKMLLNLIETVKKMH